jgi:chaperonin GroES
LIDVPENLTTAGGKLPIRMLHDRILVALRKEDGDRRSSGGILIPATAQVAKRLVWGEARGVGASCRQVKVGDQVLFSPEDQHEVEVHGEDLIILRERDVHAVAAERIEESTGLYL